MDRNNKNINTFPGIMLEHLVCRANDKKKEIKNNNKKQDENMWEESDKFVWAKTFNYIPLNLVWASIHCKSILEKEDLEAWKSWSQNFNSSTS